MLERFWNRAGPLGSLERRVMDVVWSGGPYTVREVQDRVQKPIAYTTVMTTLDRLYKKGLVRRTRSGRAFLYTAAQSREQFEAGVATGVVNGLIAQRAGAAMPILSNLVDAVSREDGGLDLLEALEAMVRERRRRIEREEDER
jgi:predicted transcriptional regulator